MVNKLRKRHSREAPNVLKMQKCDLFNSWRFKIFKKQIVVCGHTTSSTKRVQTIITYSYPVVPFTIWNWVQTRMSYYIYCKYLLFIYWLLLYILFTIGYGLVPLLCFCSLTLDYWTNTGKELALFVVFLCFKICFKNFFILFLLIICTQMFI